MWRDFGKYDNIQASTCIVAAGIQSIGLSLNTLSSQRVREFQFLILKNAGGRLENWEHSAW
jgi:hypothetical protein